LHDSKITYSGETIAVAVICRENFLVPD